MHNILIITYIILSLVASTLTKRERVWQHQHSKPVPLECGYEFAGSETAVKSRQNCNDVWSIYSTRAQLYFLMAAFLCIACGADSYWPKIQS